MIAVEWRSPSIEGLAPQEAAAVRDFDVIRQADITSLRRFVEQNRGLLTGRVLDFGAGRPGTCRQPEPYRDLVAGEYVSFDKGDPPPQGTFDAILTTQVMQYLSDPAAQVKEFARLLKPGGHLLIAYPTSWDEVEATDLWRFTKTGMEAMVNRAGLVVVSHQRRASVKLNHFQFPLGYGLVARKPARRTDLDEETGAAFLAAKIRLNEPFLFIRYGDGALECMNGLGAGHTCDGEPYSRALGDALRDAWARAMAIPGVIASDWLAASFFGEDDPTRYAQQWEALVTGHSPLWVHPESLLWMQTRRSTAALVDFFRAMQKDPRRKLLMAPLEMRTAAERLKCDHLITPMSGMFEQRQRLTEELLLREFDVLLWGCGMAGTLPVVDCCELHPERTYINIGSSLDPLYRGRTRSRQMKAMRIRRELGW